MLCQQYALPVFLCQLKRGGKGPDKGVRTSMAHPNFPARLSTTIQVWIERSRQRRALGELADRNDHLLADIGLSVEQARREAAEPFWVSSKKRDAFDGAPGSQDACPEALRCRNLRC
jgi:uncharacterized protein YjiS (DUF1127 family)